MLILMSSFGSLPGIKCYLGVGEPEACFDAVQEQTDYGK